MSRGMEVVASLGAISRPQRANAGDSQPDAVDQLDPWRLHKVPCLTFNNATSIIVISPWLSTSNHIRPVLIFFMKLPDAVTIW